MTCNTKRETEEIMNAVFNDRREDELSPIQDFLLYDGANETRVTDDDEDTMGMSSPECEEDVDVEQYLMDEAASVRPEGKQTKDWSRSTTSKGPGLDTRELEKSICRDCRRFPIEIVDENVTLRFIRNATKKIEKELQRLFPSVLYFKIEINHGESARDGRGRTWVLKQVICSSNTSSDTAAELVKGEYVTQAICAYDSVYNILKKAEPEDIVQLPMTWKTVNPYADMVCSSCNKMKTCMQSGEAWMKEVEKTEPRLWR